MKYLLWIYFAFSSKNILSQMTIYKSEFYIGTSLGNQQVLSVENAVNNTNPLYRNSPNWIQLYQVGYNYSLIKYRNFNYRIGIQLHEKGSSNKSVNLLNPPNYESTREENTVKFFLINQMIEYNAQSHTFCLGMTYGRDVFKLIPLNIRELALVVGFKKKIHKRLACGLLFNQGLNKFLQSGVTESYNSNIDLNIYCFF